MADTRRTWAALAALYADNTAGAISPQDLRDGFKSLQPHATSSAPDENDDETSGFDTDHAWIDTSTEPMSLYRCLDASTGSAVWAKIYPQDAGGGAGALDDLTDVDTSGATDNDLLGLQSGVWAPIASTSDFATAAQGATADAALPKLATVSTEGGNHTLDSGDSGAYIRVTGAATITLPDSLATGFQCVIVNATDSDTVALSAETTLTIPTGFDAEVQNRRAVTVVHVGANVWEAHGALVESS